MNRRSMTCRPLVTAAVVVALIHLSPAAADTEADALAATVRSAIGKTQSLQAKVTLISAGKTYEGSATLARPNRARLDLPNYPSTVYASDGKDYFTYSPETKQYRKTAPGNAGESIFLPLMSLRLHFRPDQLLTSGTAIEKSEVRTESVGGIEYRVIHVTYKPVALRVPLPVRKPDEKPAPPPAAQQYDRSVSYLVNPVSNLVERYRSEIRFGERTTRVEEILTGVKLNEPVAAALFAWTPPAEAKPFQVRTVASYDADLVAVGKPAPDFSLFTTDGQKVTLSTVTPARKAVLVNFWFHG